MSDMTLSFPGTFLRGRRRTEPRSRFADLHIAATAHANGLDLYTRNGHDLLGLEGLVQVVNI